MNPTADTPDRKSTFHTDVAGEILTATAQHGRAMQVGLAQYQTPKEWAQWFYTLLPNKPVRRVFDPQCASGHLLAPQNRMSAWGWDIDPRFMGEDLWKRAHDHVTGNCVELWRMLDELFPKIRFQCQVANPPFSIQWILPDGSTADSTAYTWRRIQDKAAEDGFGFFIANASTIERLGLHQEPTVYLYQRFPVGMFPDANVEIGVIHWWRRRAPTGVAGPTAPRLCLTYQTLNRMEHAPSLSMLRTDLESLDGASLALGCDGSTAAEITEAWNSIRSILQEERESRPPFNIYLRDQKLVCWLSTRLCIQEGLSLATVQRIMRIHGSHPLALAPEANTRRTLREVVDAGIYTIQPEAEAAIRDALAQVDRLAVPIMPVTSFEAVAYADEMDEIQCQAEFESAGRPLNFNPGSRYGLSSGVYRFTERFTRTKLEYSESEQTTETVVHEFSLSGEDRYIEVKDDLGVVHRFMDRPADKPQGNWLEHPESLLWQIFVQPTIPSIAESLPNQVAENRRKLSLIESTIAA